jgi:hypothetical protein
MTAIPRASEDATLVIVDSWGVSAEEMEDEIEDETGTRGHPPFRRRRFFVAVLRGSSS